MLGERSHGTCTQQRVNIADARNYNSILPMHAKSHATIFTLAICSVETDGTLAPPVQSAGTDIVGEQGRQITPIF